MHGVDHDRNKWKSEKKKKEKKNLFRREMGAMWRTRLMQAQCVTHTLNIELLTRASFQY